MVIFDTTHTEGIHPGIDTMNLEKVINAGILY